MLYMRVLLLVFVSDAMYILVSLSFNNLMSIYSIAHTCFVPLVFHDIVTTACKALSPLWASIQPALTLMSRVMGSQYEPLTNNYAHLY